MLDEIKKAVKHDCIHNDGIMISVTLKEMIWLMEQAEEFERYKKYVMYFAGKDRVNDIRLAMRDKELD